MPVIKAICDRVAVLDKGVVVEQGPVFDVFTAPKSEVTRSMVRDLVDRELPDWLIEKMNSHAGLAGNPNNPAGKGNPVLRITFSGPHANEPVIADLVKRFDVVLNIIQANVDYIQGLPFGIIIVEAEGSQEAIGQAIAHVNGQDLKAEVLGHVAGNDPAAA
jgi:D-methionine transport system ATP-binding protein